MSGLLSGTDDKRWSRDVGVRSMNGEGEHAGYRS
jgi:hypothetical protein